MPISFGSGGGGGSGLPYIRFSPSINQWMKQVEGGSEEFEPKLGPMIIDIERLQMGWMLLETGNRDWQPWPALNARTKKPEGDYKEGFAVHVYSKKLLGEEAYEFSANNVASTMFIQALYNAAEPLMAKGQVPVVQITGTKALKIGKGNTREIQFEIVKWVDRPEVLDATSHAAAEEPPFKADKPKPAAAKTLVDADEEF